jgi:4-amino-4-deoxy-L-arabinose transferase-like glycosyltransferase
LKSKTRSLWAIVALVTVGLAVVGQRRLALRDYVLDGVLFLAIAVVLFLVAVSRKGASEESAVWPQNVTVSQGAAGVALAHGRLQKVLFVAVVLFSVVAFASLGDNQFTLRGVLCWVGAVLAWLLATVHVRPGALPWRMPEPVTLREALRRGSVVMRASWVTLLLLCILIVSFFFHVYRIDVTPAEAQSDHVEASEDVRSILNGDHMIFFPRNTGREATQFYLTAALSHIFGYSFFTLKLTMALVGTLNVIPMYFLGKEFLDKRFGLLAAFFMAISYWHVIVSRIGWRIVLAPFWTTVTLYFLLRAFRTGRRNDYLLTGLSLGAGLYGYMSFRVTPLLVVALFVLKAMIDRGPRFQWKRFLTNGILLVVTSMLVYLPMFRYMYDEPRMLWYRVLTRTTELERTIEKSPTAIFVNNVKRALQMFNWMGDGAWTTSVPGRPALDYVSGGLFVLGAAYLLYLLLLKRRPIALYLVVAIFVLLLPSTLAIAFPIENPSSIRASGVIPVMILLVALPLYLVGRRVVDALRGGTGILLVVVLGGLLLWQAAQLNHRLYFVDYDLQYRRAAWNASDIARVMCGFADTLGSIYDAHYIGTAHWVDHRAIALTLRNMEWNNLIMNMTEAEPHLAEPRNRLYILHPSNAEAERWLREHYPNGQLMRFQAFIPEKDFLIYLAPAQP